MSENKLPQKSADWGSEHLVFTAEEGELSARLIIGYILGEFEIDDRYVVDFSLERKNLEQTDRIPDAIKLRLNFDNWDDLKIWVNEILGGICLVVYIKNEWNRDFTITDEKIHEKIRSCIMFISSKFSDARKHILSLRKNPKLSQDNADKNKPH